MLAHVNIEIANTKRISSGKPRNTTAQPTRLQVEGVLEPPSYKSQANPILCASLILAIDLWDFGCEAWGLRTVRTVRIGA